MTEPRFVLNEPQPTPSGRLSRTSIDDIDADHAGKIIVYDDHDLAARIVDLLNHTEAKPMMTSDYVAKAARLLDRRDELIAERDMLGHITSVTFYRQGGYQENVFRADDAGTKTAFDDIIEAARRHITQRLEANAQALRDLGVEVAS